MFPVNLFIDTYNTLQKHRSLRYVGSESTRSPKVVSTSEFHDEFSKIKKKDTDLTVKFTLFSEHFQCYFAFQILVPLYHLLFSSKPAIHAATHETREAYRRPAKSLVAMRGLHAKIVQLSTTHTHHELTSSTLLQKHARLDLALRRSLVLDHRKLVCI
jgi:hypothetical protein